MQETEDVHANGCHLTLREGDIILASFPKCGSTWMQYIVLALLNAGNLDGIMPNEQAPLMDYLLLRKAIRRGKTKDTHSVEKVQAALDAGVLGDATPLKRRVFKTHQPVDSVLWEGGLNGIPQGAKIIVTHRNPKDVAVSWFHQNVANQRYSPDSFEEFVHDFTAGKVVSYPNDVGSFWLWYHNWWKFARESSAVLCNAYEDQKRDLSAAIRRIANFIGVAASEELVAKVAQAATFDSMKERLVGQNVPKLRRGVAGGWRDYLTGDLLVQFDKAHAKNMADLDMHFEFDFGDNPHEGTVGDIRPSGKKKNKRDSEFDWSKAAFGRFVMKMAYVGTGYQGMVWQESSTCLTVESRLFAALKTTRLIKDRQSCSYSRCSATDKGVHAAGNYVSLELRLKPQGSGTSDDYDYASILNRVLPADIRILAVSRAELGFDASCSCLYRIYRYYFPITGEELSKMHEAAKLFLGEHDFRNFCKNDSELDVCRCQKILYAGTQGTKYCEIGEITIAGTEFLRHQVRCMVAVLQLIGRGLEEPSVITQLLDVEKHPRKPVYDMVDESGLVLFDCAFEGVCFSAADWASEASKADSQGTTAHHVAGTQSLRRESGTCSIGGLQESSDSFCQMRSQALRMAAVHSCLISAVERESARLSRTAAASQGSSRTKYTPLLRRAVEAQGRDAATDWQIAATLAANREDAEKLEAKRRRKGESSNGGI